MFAFFVRERFLRFSLNSYKSCQPFPKSCKLRSETSEFLGKHQLHYRNSLRTLILICWLPHCRLTQTALRVSKQKLQITSTRTLPIYPKLPWHCLPKRWRLERPIPMPITIREVADAELFALLCLYAHLHPEDEMLPLGEAMPTWKTLRQDPNQQCFGVNPLCETKS